MNKMKTLLLTSVLCLAFLGACKDDDDPVSCNWTVELQDEADAVTAAATTYGNNPTPANCQAFKNAYQEYLDEAEKRIDCATVAGQREELENAIDQAQESLDNLQC